MNKEELYKQIEEFNTKLTNPADISSKTFQEAYLYVDTEDARDKANFVGFLIKKGVLQSRYNKILDLTFGSGNLTSHIVFDNDIEYENIIFNDINTEKTNQNIVTYVENSNIDAGDILNKDDFEDTIADLVILNPQIGGNYIDGDILKQKKQKEKQQDVLDRLNQTIQKFINDGATILFYGKEKDFKSIFGEVIYIKYKSKLNNLFVVDNSITESKCYEKEGSSFIKCKDISDNDEEIESFDDIDLEEFNDIPSESTTPNIQEEKYIFNKEEKGSLTFPYKNILFKGVPGTGKSRAVDNIIKNQLKIDINSDNVLRVNIHSASSNADLMQGIGIGSNGGQIEYKEKQGLVMDLIKRATFTPNQPFALVLEEIQENSLNELIGDLIYLIEDSKRADVSGIKDGKYSYQELIEKAKPEHFVKIPYLVSDKTEYRKMILPKNLYVFCTSNYRDDKKVIEDNLLRRFEVIEIYPDKTVVSKDYQEFFESLNSAIREVLADEIHPDRYMIGHAIWKDLSNDKDFYRAYLKLVIEFKDIREIDFPTLKEILQKVEFPEGIDSFISGSNEAKDYFELISKIQDEIDYKSLWKDENNQ